MRRMSTSLGLQARSQWSSQQGTGRRRTRRPRRREARAQWGAGGQNARAKRCPDRLVVRGWRRGSWSEVGGATRWPVGCKTRGQPTKGAGGAESGAVRERAGGAGDIERRRWSSRKTALEQKREAEPRRCWGGCGAEKQTCKGAGMVLLACG
jgi:hypothetical protein